MSQQIADLSDVWPWNSRLSRQQVGGEGFDGFTNLDEANAHRIEDQAVAEVSSLQMLLDGLHGRSDVVQALPIARFKGVAHPTELIVQRDP